MTIISVDDLSVRYNGSLALEELELRVPAGGWVGVIGPNGAGKTTLLRSVAGLVAFTGDVHLDDAPVSSMDRRTRAGLVAYVPQRPVIPDGMRVTDYVLMGRTAHIPYLGVESARDIAIAGDAMDRLELRSMAHRTLGTLSGGELQRAILARALVQETPVLLLDEPTAALDIGHQQEALELLDEMRRERGLTVLSAMHDLTLAAQFAHELLLLSGGRAVGFGPPRNVLTEGAVSRHFNASVRIVEDENGLHLIPTRTRNNRAAG